MPKAFRIQVFSGMVPRVGRRLLQESQAQVATNARLLNGQLEPMRDTQLINNPAVTGLLSVYKLTQAGVDYWLCWDVDVDAAKGPIAGDTTNRTYFTGDNEPRVTDFTLATGSTPYPAAWYVLGVTPPITAPAISHTGGVGAAIDRAFVYTFVTPWGEESKPSPASAVVTGKVDGTWTVSGMDVAPLNTFTVTGASWASGVATLTVASTFGLRVGEEINVSGVNPAGYNVTGAVITAVTSTTVSYAVAADPGAYVAGGSIARVSPHNTTGMTKNIYWTETNSAGTQYQLVKSGVAVADASTAVAGNTTPQEEITTTDWGMPPVGLKGLMFHPSGAAVGFSKNQLCFSEPYAPYAWPLEFQFTVDYDIVGIGIFGTTVVVTTKGSPYMATGVDPESMVLTRVDQPWPCLAKRGVVSLNYSVMYPAPQGLVAIGANGPELVTQSLYTQEAWAALAPGTFRAAPWSNRYVASYDPGDGNRKLLIIDRTEFSTITFANKHCDVVYGDQKTGYLYVVNSDKIYLWDSLESGLLNYDWMSKEFVSPELFNPGAAKLDALTLTPEETASLQAVYDAVVAANTATIASGVYDVEGSLSAIGELEQGGLSFDAAVPAPEELLQFQLWVDNKLKFSKQVLTSKAFALPAGYKTDAVAVRITGNVKVLGVVIAETMDGLRTV